MGIVFIFLTLFLTMSLTAYILDLKIEEALPISNFIIIIVLYFSGILFLNLNIGLIALGILTLGVLVKFFKDKKNKKTNFFTKIGLIYFCVIFLFSILFPYNREFVSWDEFSHWGLVVKNMYTLNSFGNLKEATTLFKGYPPAMSIFQYFFIKLSGTYRENLAFSAMIFFNLSLFSLLLKNIKNLIEAILLSVLIIGFSSFISLGVYSTIYIDLSLGFLSAYILFINFKNEVTNKISIVNLSLALFILPLMKSSGTFLGVMILILILLDLSEEEIQIKEKFLKASILVLFIIAGKYSWDIYTKLTSDFTGAWGGMKNFTLTKILNFWLIASGEKYQFEVKSNFINALSEKRFDIFLINYYKVSMLSISLIVIFISILIYLCFEKNRKLKRSLLYVNFIGLIYIFSLLNLYIYTFSEYEAVRLASFERYLNTYLVLISTFLFYVIINEVNKFNKKILKVFLLFIIIIGLKIQYKNIKLEFFKKIKRIEFNENLKRVINKNDKLYFICQASNGYEYWVARYEYTPAHMIENWSWSIGEKYSAEDVWTQNITLDQFEENLKKATYVYLYKIDEKFIEKYGDIFKEKNLRISTGDIFKIVNENGEFEFIKMNN
ncbi:MAG: hypothetical protein ACRDA0_07965 [Cetobacterium sp.]|uniref:hypothetical protein n=1 Tax=Cetobacterium sp. TaxID=2071632 RepID=UPI003F311EC5